MALMTLQPVSLGSAGVTEKMVQEQIAADPALLGLGTLELRDKDRIQAHAGRLDLANQRDVLRDLVEQAWVLNGRP